MRYNFRNKNNIRNRLRVENRIGVESLESRCMLAVPLDGLVAYYPFNGNSRDESNNGNDSIGNEAVLTTDRFDVQDRAYSFNGDNDYISVRDSSSLDIRGPLTFSALVNPEIGTGYAISKGAYNLRDNYSIFLADGFPSIKVHTSSGTSYSLSSSSRIPLGQWSHIVGTYDRNKLAIYVNGEIQNNRELSGELYTNSARFYIGMNYPTDAFKGKIDEVAVYNRALTSDEIRNFFSEHTGADIRRPVVIVPGILGSLQERFSSRATDIKRFLQNVVFENGGVVIKPFHPDKLKQERVINTYKPLVDSFLARGYSLCDLDNPDITNDSVDCQKSDLFFAAYDWRQPVLINPKNTEEILWDEDKNTFNSGVEYLEWWINLAKEKWVARGGQPANFSVDVIAHSLGGLLARAYIEEAEEAGRLTEKVSNLIMLGTPNHGSVSTYQFLNPSKNISGGSSFINIISDSFLKNYLNRLVRNLEQTYKLKRGSVGAEHLVPSLKDVYPTFPFFRDRVLTSLETNYFLERLNKDISDLTDRTNVLLVGTKNLSTPTEIISRRGRLRFVNQLVGDGRVIYDSISGIEAGQFISDSNIKEMSILDTDHNKISSNKKVIDRIFEELTI